MYVVYLFYLSGTLHPSLLKMRDVVFLYPDRQGRGRKKGMEEGRDGRQAFCF